MGKDEIEVVDEIDTGKSLMDLLYGAADENKPEDEVKLDDDGNPIVEEGAEPKPAHIDQGGLANLVASLPDEVDPNDPVAVAAALKKKEEEGLSEEEKKKLEEEGEIDKLPYKPSDKEPDKFPEFTPKPAPTPDLKKQEEKDLLKDLLAEELYEYELAKFASETSKEHAGLDKKLLVHYKAHREFIANAIKEDPSVTLDENNHEYQEFLEKSRPPVPASELKQMERDYLDHRATTKARAEVAEQLKETNAKVDRLKIEPKIEARLAKYDNKLTTDLVPKEIATLVKEKGLQAARDAFSFEYDIVDGILSETSAYGKALVEISEGLVKYDVKNIVHKNIFEYVEEQGQILWKEGAPKQKVQNGKKFLPASEFSKALRAGEQDKYFTFSVDQVLEMLQIRAKREISTGITVNNEKMEKAGYKREGKGIQIEEPKKKKSKATKPSPSSGSQPGSDDTGKVESDNPVMNILYPSTSK